MKIYILLLYLLFFCCINYSEPSIELKLVTNRDYYPTLRDLLRASRDYAYFAIYVAKIEGENQVSMLLNELAKAKEIGLDIKVILDSSSFDENLNRTNNIFADSLKKYGISVRFDDPDTTSHCKFGVFDDKIVIIGSTNWTYSSLEKNNEVNIVISNEEVAYELKRYFYKLWGKE